MSDFLNQSGAIYTSARDNGQGLPLTDVSIKESIGYDSADDMMKIKSTQKKWKDSFSQTSLNATRWEVVQTGAGMTVDASGVGTLVISGGTTANSETIIRSREYFTIPARSMFLMALSQRIANQDIVVEFISVDPVTLLADGIGGSAIRVSYEDSATANNAVVTTTAGGSAVSTSPVYSTGVTMTSQNIYEIELFSDEIWFHHRVADSEAGRVASKVRNTNIPDPNGVYKVQMRVKNKATAPASNTVVTFQGVTVIDYAELTAEITAGRGNISAGQAMAVTVANTPAVTVSGTPNVSVTNTPNVSITNTPTVNSNASILANNTVATDTTTNLGASATFTGTGKDLGATMSYNRLRVLINHLAGQTPGHLVIEHSSDNATWKETHRIPVPSDTLHRTFEFPLIMRYVRIKFINGATAQTGVFIASSLVRTDGPFDLDKSLLFLHSTTALGVSATFTGATLELGSNTSVNRHRATVFADQIGTLQLQESRDGTLWRTISSLATTASTLGLLESVVTGRYVRVVFVNGATANTVFELQSSLVKN